MDLSEIDVYIERRRRSSVTKALEKLDDEKREMFWTAVGRREPDLRRPATAVAKWLTATSGVNVTHNALNQWLKTNE